MGTEFYSITYNNKQKTEPRLPLKTLIGISVTVVIIMLPIEAVVQAHPNQERVYQNVSAHNRVHKGPACAFDTLPMEEKAVAWLDMSPRHRDFHWRAMSAEERLKDFQDVGAFWRGWYNFPHFCDRLYPAKQRIRI